MNINWLPPIDQKKIWVEASMGAKKAFTQQTFHLKNWRTIVREVSSTSFAWKIISWPQEHQKCILLHHRGYLSKLIDFTGTRAHLGTSTRYWCTFGRVHQKWFSPILNQTSLIFVHITLRCENANGGTYLPNAPLIPYHQGPARLGSRCALSSPCSAFVRAH